MIDTFVRSRLTCFTTFACVSGRTDTSVAVTSVDTLSSIHTWATEALISICIHHHDIHHISIWTVLHFICKYDNAVVIQFARCSMLHQTIIIHQTVISVWCGYARASSIIVHPSQFINHNIRSIGTFDYAEHRPVFLLKWLCWSHLSRPLQCTVQCQWVLGRWWHDTGTHSVPGEDRWHWTWTCLTLWWRISWALYGGYKWTTCSIL